MADEASAPPIKPQYKPTPTNFPSHFLLRALIALFFFIVIPILPSIAPEFLNQNFFSQSWELLHIVFVGIAVSYGLFSRRYDDSGGEAPHKTDPAQSYVSRLLQVSSVFDDEVDSPTGSPLLGDGGSKVQTWSSQYFRNEPVVVVVSKKQVGSAMADDDHKPLLLPVRSLKSRVSDENGGGECRVSGRSYARSNSYGSNSAPKEPLNWEMKIRNGSLKSRASDSSEVSGFDPNSTSELESVVLPSPIPWRSRSGRLEKKKEDDLVDLDHLPPMASLFESQSKRSEDSTRRKAVYRSPPLPLPPPPVALFSKSSLAKAKTGMADHGNEASPWEESPSSKLDYSPCGRSCRTVRSRNWKEADEEPEELAHDGRSSSFSDYTNERKGDGDDLLGEAPATSDDDAEEDDEFPDAEELKEPENGREEGGGASSSGVDDEGPDVDKKADEFIAKFREQIRLQRIGSIKRSTGQFSRDNESEISARWI